MLKFLSKRKRSRNAILIVFIFAMIITLVAFFTATRSGGAAGASDNAALVAKVDGLPVTLGEFKQTVALFSPNDPQLRDPQTMMNLKMRGLDKTIRERLIRERIVQLEANRLGLNATDDEVRERIRQNWSTDGKFVGEEEYKRRLAQRGYAWQDYERDLRNSITQEKLNKYLTDGVAVSPQEVENEYKRTETSVNLTYGVIKPSDVRDSITLSDEELRAYFNAHKENFKISQDQKKVDYLFVSTNELSKTLPVDDADLHKRYDTTDQIDQAHIRQIVLNVLATKDDSTVKQKADDLVKQARGAGDIKAQDFATLAKGNSQDTASAAKGGDIGYIKRDRNKPNDVYQRAFTMNDGDISEPIKQGSKYYIIKVEDKKKRTFEEAKEGLVASARNDLAYKKGVQVADEAHTLLVQNHDLAKTAEAINQKYGPGAAVVKSTPYVAQGDNVPDIGSNQNFEESYDKLKNKGDIGDKVGVPNGFAVPVLADTRGPHDAAFEEVKDKVEREAKVDKSKEVAGQKARAIAQAATTPDALKAALEAAKLKAETKDDFKNGQTLTGVGQSAGVEAAALNLKAGEVDKTPIKVGTDFVILAATNRKDADMAKFTTGDQKKTTTDRMLQERKDAVFSAYLDARYRALEQAGKIKIYDEALNNLLQESIPVEP